MGGDSIDIFIRHVDMEYLVTLETGTFAQEQIIIGGYSQGGVVALVGRCTLTVQNQCCKLAFFRARNYNKRPIS